MRVPDRIETARLVTPGANDRSRRLPDPSFARIARPSLTLQVESKTCSVSHSLHEHLKSDMFRRPPSHQLNQIGRSATRSIRTDSRVHRDLKFPRDGLASGLSLRLSLNASGAVARLLRRAQTRARSSISIEPSLTVGLLPPQSTKSLLYVCHQIVNTFDAHRNPNQSIIDSKLKSSSWRQISVRSCCRVKHTSKNVS